MMVLNDYGYGSELEALGIIKKHIEIAIEPFKPGNVKTEIMSGFTGPWYSIFVWCENLDGEMAQIRDDAVHRFIARGDLFFLANEVGLEAGRQFAAIYIQPEENIELGEN